jgi:hypothetical protein
MSVVVSAIESLSSNFERAFALFLIDPFEIDTLTPFVCSVMVHSDLVLPYIYFLLYLHLNVFNTILQPVIHVN